MAPSSNKRLSRLQRRVRSERSSLNAVSKTLQTSILWNQAGLRFRRKLPRFKKTNYCKFYVIALMFILSDNITRSFKQNRQNQKAKMRSDVDKIRKKLLEVAMRSAAVRTVTTHEASPTKKTSTNSKNADDDLFKLPVLENIIESSGESEEEKKDEKLVDTTRNYGQSKDLN